MRMRKISWVSSTEREILQARLRDELLEVLLLALARHRRDETQRTVALLEQTRRLHEGVLRKNDRLGRISRDQFACLLPLRVLPPPLPLPGFHITAVWHEVQARDPGHAWLREMLVATGEALDAADATA